MANVDSPITSTDTPTVPTLTPTTLQPSPPSSVDAQTAWDHGLFAPGWDPPETSQIFEWVKRGVDILVSFTGLALASPLLAAVATSIKLQDGGPVLFAQKRVGADGREFRFYKFRSMVLDADEIREDLMEQNHLADDVKFKMPEDPRVTRVGRFLRRTSIDELPQLWNVLIGNMTLVGPRPPIPSEVENYTPFQRRRLSVKPGLTCIWQVSGRSELPFDDQVAMDLEYIENRSLWLDFSLLLRTIPAVLFMEGAY